ncbi:poly(U)-specific endoribonuclease-B-like isoform X2 [Hibiscus syriacus]|uniref:poly(U)-specific endoribonuclease-B-like isoform X2 n=1 Tax=Hibiscus syriacus TaxID=106335 RepID=UPI0019228F63|nr:poly(U)-specific endoribonuclease-B-like isoform X2 [Hibiscus syriacus]XP_038996258.1 poly(U)-specific endoribonuclease-B-like isoform X2 [Hibiscus syriacus]
MVAVTEKTILEMNVPDPAGLRWCQGIRMTELVLRLTGENRSRVNRLTWVQDLPVDPKRLIMEDMRRMSVTSDMLITKMSGTGRSKERRIMMAGKVLEESLEEDHRSFINYVRVHMDHWQGYKKVPSEQEYGDEVGTGTSIEPSEEELADLSQACNRLWQLDLNRLEPGKDFQLDCGEGKRVHQKEDMAEESLFYSLSEDIFRKPTFSRFCALLDNYNPNAGCKEVVTTEEKQEQSAFIEEISRTAPIKYLHRYLSLKGIVSENYQDFKRMLTKLWFDLYGRGGTSGSSSAFEHVFVGEIKQRGEEEVTGFHNWLQFYLEEAKGRVDYQGYILPRRRGETPDSETQLLTIQFEWNGVRKAVSSTMVGVSPEFELALYTLCFFVGGEDNYVQLGPYSVNIKCYRFGDKIGSVFPIAEC